MTNKLRSQRIDTIFVLLIFCIFAVSVLMVLMLCASTYKNTTEISKHEQDERTALSYIRTKVRNSDNSGEISTGYYHGFPAIFFDEVINDTPYRTVIYHYNGWVYELFSETGLDFYPEDGTQIIRVGDLAFETGQYGLIKISSGTRSLLLSPRGGTSGVLPGAAHTEGGPQG